MVATSKLRRAQQRVQRARPFAERVAAVVENLITPEIAEIEPILRQPERIRRAAVILMTSNRGLCGAFNVNLIRKAREQLGYLEESGVDTEFHVVGKKGIAYFRFRGVPMASTRTDITDAPTTEQARELVNPLAQRFVARSSVTTTITTRPTSTAFFFTIASRSLPSRLPHEPPGARR